MSEPLPTLPGRLTLSYPGPSRYSLTAPGPSQYTVVPVPGPPGPPGEASGFGPDAAQEMIDDTVGQHVVAEEPHPALRRHIHTQSAPSASWVIDHGLGKIAHVSIFSSTAPPWELVYTDVDHGSLDQTTITFPTPATGLAVLS